MGENLGDHPKAILMPDPIFDPTFSWPNMQKKLNPIHRPESILWKGLVPLDEDEWQDLN